MKCFLAFCLLLQLSDCARILGIFPVSARSHYILGSSLMRSLAERGHDVTIIAPLAEKNPPPNYKQVLLTGFWEQAEKRRNDTNFFDVEDKNVFLLTLFYHRFFVDLTEEVLKHPNVQILIKSRQKFDVVIVEQFLDDALKGFASLYNAPLVIFSTIGANSFVNFLVGNPAPTSYIPGLFLSYSAKMDFFQRTVNSLMYIFNEVVSKMYTYPQHAALVKKYFPDGISLELYNVSLVLLNAHPSTNQPVPLVPNMIDIGGFHIQETKPLPKDLQTYLDEAKEGVIYFSLGSNLKSTQLPPEKRDAFLKTFRNLKEKIIWKWENESLFGEPSNVKMGKWLPQQDILAHPNVKLFITHGGLLSLSETIYHGVPILAIPIYGDQKFNAQFAVNNGYGLKINYQDISEDKLSELIKELLENPKYQQNAKRKSQIFHDRPASPMDTANFWLEYVIRHKGAPHLRVAALDLPLYQYFLLDVIFFLLVLFTVFFSLLYVLFKTCWRLSQTRTKIKKS